MRQSGLWRLVSRVAPCPALTLGLWGLLSMSHLKLSLMESWLLRAAFSHCGPQLTLSKGPTADSSHLLQRAGMNPRG